MNNQFAEGFFGSALYIDIFLKREVRSDARI